MTEYLIDLSYTSDYKEYLDSLKKKQLSLYEKVCLFFRRFPQILKPHHQRKERLEKVIQYCELEILPEDIDNTAFYLSTASFIVLSLLSFFKLTSFWINITLTAIIFYSLYTYPFFLNEVTRLKANSEMVKAIVYMSISLTITPVFVNAISFASRYLDGPIGNDFRKIMWIIKTQQAQNLETAISYFIDKWNNWNKNFSEALELLKQVEVYVSQEEKENTIREALALIEETSYDVMKDYSKSLKQPLNIIHSFGIMMPILGLIMFPLISIFLSSEINIKYLITGYIIILPSMLFWYIYKVISKRPGAFAHSLSISISRQYKKIKIMNKEISLLKLSIAIGLLALMPTIFHFYNIASKHHTIFSQHPLPEAKEMWKNYVMSLYNKGQVDKDLITVLLGIWGMALAIIIYAYYSSAPLKKMDEYVRSIEDQLILALSILSKYLKQNMPFEIAINKMIEEYKKMGMKKYEIVKFFEDLRYKMYSSALPLEDIILGRSTYGEEEQISLLEKFPSSIIKDVLKIIISVIKKGTQISSIILKNISYYLQKLKNIEKLIDDLLTDVLSSLSMQAKLITPIITSLVAVESVFVIQVLREISLWLMKIEETFNIATGILGGATAKVSHSLEIIKLEEVVPPTIMVFVVGIYLILSIMIITYLHNGIKYGFNSITYKYDLSKNLLYALILFTIFGITLHIMLKPILSQIVFTTGVG